MFQPQENDFDTKFHLQIPELNDFLKPKQFFECNLLLTTAVTALYGPYQPDWKHQTREGPPSSPAFFGGSEASHGESRRVNQEGFHFNQSRQARKRGVDMERVMSGKVASVVDIDKDGWLETGMHFEGPIAYQ